MSGGLTIYLFSHIYSFSVFWSGKVVEPCRGFYFLLYPHLYILRIYKS